MNDTQKNSIKLGGFNNLIRMRDGWMVYDENDTYIGKSIKEYGEWCQEEIDLCKQCLKKNDVVIEVGSNIGSHTLAISQTVHEGTVFAFEPQNVIFQNLCANLSINSITNCFCFNSALSDKREEKLYFPNYDFTKEQNFSAMSFLRASEKGHSIQANVDTLDSKFSELNKLNLLKIDAEGMEKNIIRGGINLIRRTRPFLYIENNLDYIEQSKELIEMAFSLDYRLFWHVSYMYNKNNYFKNMNNVFGRNTSCNMLGIRKDVEIKIHLPEVKSSSQHPFKE